MGECALPPLDSVLLEGRLMPDWEGATPNAHSNLQYALTLEICSGDVAGSGSLRNPTVRTVCYHRQATSVKIYTDAMCYSF